MSDEVVGRVRSFGEALSRRSVDLPGDVEMRVSKATAARMARDIATLLAALATAQAEWDAEPVAWGYCPECGSEKYERTGHANGRFCSGCGQEWFPDIDYSRVVRAHLSSLATAHGDVKRLIALNDETTQEWGEDLVRMRIRAEQAESDLATLRERLATIQEWCGECEGSGEVGAPGGPDDLYDVVSKPCTECDGKGYAVAVIRGEDGLPLYVPTEAQPSRLDTEPE